jgi:hypothetical protein
MTTQDGALKVYYAAMDDADLLKLAANRRSYIEAAQKMMDYELERRHLSPPRPAQAAGSSSRLSFHGLFHRHAH